jgi:hypothetical protein
MDLENNSSTWNNSKCYSFINIMLDIVHWLTYIYLIYMKIPRLSPVTTNLKDKNMNMTVWKPVN